jgi:hypothetical protein
MHYDGPRLVTAKAKDVKGIPTLIILNKDGSIANKNARSDVILKKPEKAIENWIA